MSSDLKPLTLDFLLRVFRVIRLRRRVCFSPNPLVLMPINWCWSPRSRPSSYQSASERLVIGTMLPCCFPRASSASSGCSIKSASAGAARLSPPFVSFTPSPIMSSLSVSSGSLPLFLAQLEQSCYCALPPVPHLSSYEHSSSLSALAALLVMGPLPFVNPVSSCHLRVSQPSGKRSSAELYVTILFCPRSLSDVLI